MSKIINRSIIFALIILVASFTSSDFIGVKVGKHVALDIPNNFFQMTNDDIVKDFGTIKMPLALYTNQEKTVFISINEKIDSLSKSNKVAYKASNPDYQDDLKIYKSFQKASLMYLYSEIKFITDTLVITDDSKYMTFEFDALQEGEDDNGTSMSTRHYNYIRHYFVKNRTYIINIRVPQERKEEFLPIVKVIVNSVKVG